MIWVQMISIVLGIVMIILWRRFCKMPGQNEVFGRRLQGILTGWMSLAVVLPMLLNRALICHAVYVGDAVLLAGVFLNVRRAGLQQTTEDHPESEKRRQKFYVAIMTVLFLASLSVFRIFVSPLYQPEQVSQYYQGDLPTRIGYGFTLLYIPALIVSAYICFHRLSLFLLGYLHLSCPWNREASMSDQPAAARQVWCCFLIIAVVSLLFLSSTYPGIWISDDVYTVYTNAMAHLWSDWHTIGFELFVSVFGKILKNTFMVNVAQTIIWLVFQRYILSLLAEKRGAMKLYTLLSVTFFTPYNYLECAIKDTVFAMGILALTAAMFAVVHKEKISWRDGVIGSIGAVMVSSFRHGGFVVVMVALGVLFAYCCFIKANRRRIWAVGSMMASSIGIYILLYAVLFHTLSVAPNAAYVKYSTPVAMISAAAHDGVEFEAEDVQELEKVMPMSEWGERYNKYWSDSVARDWCNPNVGKLAELVEHENLGKTILRINAKLFLKHPIVYLRALMNIDSIVLEISRPIDASSTPVVSLCKVPVSDQIKYQGGFAVTDPITRLTDDVPVLAELYQRGGAYLLTMVILMGAFFVRRQKKLCIPMLAVFLNQILLCLAMPSQDPRYILPVMETAIFYVCAYLLSFPREIS